LPTTLTVTAKGQVTLRQEILRHLGVSRGEQLEVYLLPDGQATLRARGRGRIEDSFGLLARPGEPPLSIEDMNEIAAAGWAGE
jgi:bifunctional DNA-binding transcriptional regulator/antitoxin component of YhaV-PrlF toxin-antitoxin module